MTDLSINNEKILMVPGIGNSGAGHWQTLWQQYNELFERVHQKDWDNPVYEEWYDALDKAISRYNNKVYIVAHSLGCLLTCAWANQSAQNILGALLVAVPNPEGAAFPLNIKGFPPVSRNRLNFNSVVVASYNDPYADITFSQSVARDWGSRFINIGERGHINADSGMGVWQDGFEILNSVLSSKEL